MFSSKIYYYRYEIDALKSTLISVQNQKVVIESLGITMFQGFVHLTHFVK